MPAREFRNALKTVSHNILEDWELHIHNIYRTIHIQLAPPSTPASIAEWRSECMCMHILTKYYACDVYVCLSEYFETEIPQPQKLQSRVLLFRNFTENHQCTVQCSAAHYDHWYFLIAVCDFWNACTCIERVDINAKLWTVAYFVQVIRINMDEGKMDKFVFAVAQKKTAARLHKDIYDLVNKLKAIVCKFFSTNTNLRCGCSFLCYRGDN